MFENIEITDEVCDNSFSRSVPNISNFATATIDNLRAV